MRNRINWLGIACALLIPALGVLNRDSSLPPLSVEKLMTVWLTMSLFLFVIWTLNYGLNMYFSNRPQVAPLVRVGVMAVCDGLVISLIFGLESGGWFPIAFADYSQHPYQLLARLCAATLLLTTIQYAFLSTIRQEGLKRQNEQLRTENLVAELEGLKQQINPHFLFNSLGTLRAMIHEKDENAEQFVLRLSTVYRQFLSKRNETTTSLSEELAFLNHYLFMLRFRYEEGLKLVIEVDPQVAAQVRLPAFCLQLLVENCIKHNSLSMARPLSIRIYQENPRTVTVANNRQPKQTGVESTGIGLANLRKRYALLGLSNAVTIHETDERFTITVALLDA
ncbi:sensor histidine kinase [Fibrella aquatica]|uniref:sensor histidine kinase n=1 Tax=Fibrella aquatica TaxID=3242487 RepID=UPI0035217D59